MVDLRGAPMLSRTSFHSQSAIPLVPRYREDSFFDGDPAEDIAMDVSQDTRLRTAVAEHRDRMHPITAGALTGGLGAVAAVATLEQSLETYGRGSDLAANAGRMLATVVGANLDNLDARMAGIGAAVVVGGLIGAVFSLLTRHLRRFHALVVWSLLAFPAAGLVGYVFLLPRLSAAVIEALPFVPFMAATFAFAFVVSLQLPLRRRSLR